ncbi:MAG: hypothetical protein K2H37_07420, partial [Lachnospiraceae bacterium]|nr:hypothetical protein [Lachnospiraceae bacterium]
NHTIHYRFPAFNIYNTLLPQKNPAHVKKTIPHVTIPPISPKSDTLERKVIWFSAISKNNKFPLKLKNPDNHQIQ